ncbi:16S rRNA (adenine(1518)-N(6)/adenine(1519)-N(6))-dimethyltransferase RsmA [Halococcoides cellulosivorans]|uniref:Probable ribosomal RNA small subunit methyltransferase A n=1 Tax=Halococcoides cellulosivorans TaxID=1679096 RepID=A0A2R4X3F5_9EURY|nr:16S rRNA (adenine(1518)-N(6)/adenine(1519)-N(6))-dimethyltransferase RsmA [Halococcoides cellulosivorans]AWB28223.1 ribosomal RNA small subunit methyltransferase A [Halococcoides cellulosivorans]
MTDPLDDHDGRDPDALRDRAGLDPDPRDDQHLLIDDRVLDRIVGYAVEAGMDTTTVLEIGAGTGALTDRLLAVADHVVAIERDSELAAFLRREFVDAIAADRLTVIEGDALDAEWPAYTASVSNLPYGPSSELLFEMLPRGRPAVVLVQREFAERMAAGPGEDEYGRLSVTAGHYAAVTIEEPVPPTAFDPQPAVESAVVRLDPRTPTYEVSDDDRFFDVVRGVFTQRRKTTRNAIRNTTHITGIDDPAAVLDALDEEILDARPGSLAPETFARIARLA